MVLGTGYVLFYQSWFIDFLVKVHLLDDGFDETLAVGGIIDGKVGVEADTFVLIVKDAEEDRVEGAHPQVLRSFHAHLFGDALFHLSRCFIGKGEGENVPWVIFLFFE